MSRSKMASPAHFLRNPIMAALAVSIGVALSASAQAQEAGKVWTSDWLPPDPQTTEEGIQNKIKDFFANYPNGAGVQMQVTGHFVTPSKAVSKYEGVPRPPVIDPWVYSDFSISNPPPGVGSIEALEAQIALRYNQESTGEGCPAVSVVHVSPVWDEVNYWDDNATTTQGFGDYTGTRSAWTGSQCEIVNISGSTTKNRDVACPNAGVLFWSDEKQACAMPFQLTYQSETLAKNECPVGNPCDPTTGDKSEPAPDLDLGWIKFDRHYHSMASVARSGFGAGWTHSHNIQLALGTDPMDPNQTLNVGLIEADGSQLAFAALGAAYEAVDGSGDRLVADGTDWLLYRADRVLRFNANNRLVAQQLENGTSLAYVYDTANRLASITHSTGRSLMLEYNGGLEDATIAVIRSAGLALASYTYTAGGQVESVTYADGKTRSYHYEDTRFPRFLTGVTGEDDQRFSTFTYDTKARVTSSTHAGGADAVTLTYPATGGSTVTDALGAVTTYGMTPWVQDGPTRKISKFSDPVRGDIDRTYLDTSVDFRRRLSTVTDRRDVVTQHSYAEANDAVTGQPARTRSIQEAVGLAQERTTQERHDIASNRLIFTKRGNRETRITRNARLQPLTVSVKDTATSETRTTTYAYCEAADVSAPSSTCPTLGLIKSVDGPRSDVSDLVTLSYYGSDDPVCATTPAACSHRKGDLWKVTDALGRSVETLGYDALGRPLSRLDINGVATDSSYHIRGWLLSNKVRGPNNASEADDQVSAFEYWPTGLVKKVTLPDGSFTNYVYDAAQRLTDVSDSTGASIHYTLDNAGNRLVEDSKTPGGTVKRTLSRVYNTLGQLEADKNAALHATNYGYDAEDNVSSVTDPLLRQTTRQHDPLNRLSATLQDVGGIEATTALAYNEFDQVTKVTDPKLLETLYTYNAFGERTQLASPDTGITAYTFDAASNVKTATDALGITRQYTYDALNRLTAIVYPDTSLNVVFTYDIVPGACPVGEQFALGRWATMTDGSGSTAHCYDRFGRLVRKVQTTNGVGLTVKYAYNLAGQLTALTYPDGSVADYTRDAQGRVATMGVTPPGGARELLLTVNGYNPFGPGQGWTYGNGRTLVRAYDLNYAVQSLRDTASGGLDIGLARDELLQITAIHNATFATPARVKFDYDALSRLTQFRDGPSNTVLESYDYDKTGNRDAFTNSGGLQDYVYASINHKLSSVAGIARGYDAAGNTTAIGGTAKEFVYGNHGRMAQVKQLGVPVMNYAYNGVGERVRRYAGSSETYTVFDESGHWLGDYGPGGTAVQQAIWLGDQPVGLQVGPSTAIGRLHYVQPDHLGTPRSVIDPVRNVAVWTWDLAGEAFGNSVPNQDPDLDATQFVLNMRFPGQRYDSATGLNYNYYRDYDAATGRYVQSDPIGLVGGLSTYSYVESAPVNNFDPTGLQSRDLEYIYKQSGAKMPESGLYDMARQWRTWGHQTFPGEINSAMRHCTVSCIMGKRMGTALARSSGVVNEAQGLVMHDIPNMQSRLSGDSAWACQTSDLANNERGFKAAESLPAGRPADAELSKVCTLKCQQ